MAAFDKHVTAATDSTSTPAARRAASRYQSVVGLHLLAWLHQVDPYSFISHDALIAARLSKWVLDHWVRDAVTAWIVAGFGLDSSGVPVWPLAAQPKA